MSLYNRRKFLILAPLALGACGFTPIFGRGTTAESLIGKIALGPVDDRMGFEFHERLENRLGRADAPIYQLDVIISINSRGLAITQDNSITRYNLTAEADFSLTRIADNKLILTDIVRSFTAYSATATAYATHVSERDANRRLAVALADQIATRIASNASSF